MKYKKQTHKSGRKFLLLVFGAAILGGVAFLFWQRSLAVWDGRGRFTVVTVGPVVKVESFDPQLKQGFILTVPNDLEVETVGGRGKWQAGSLARTGFGKKWAAESLADYLGIYYTDESSQMPWWDRWEWTNWQRQVTWKEINLDNAGVLTEVVAVDGTPLKILGEMWPENRQNWFESAEVVNESLNVTIVNTTGVDGLGTHAARSMEADGVKVRQVISTSPEIGKCLVKSGLELKNSLGVQRIEKNINCGWGLSPEVGVRVELGKAYRDWWL